MDQETCNASASFALGVVVGMFITITFSTPDCKWRAEAIEHGAAEYSSKTGEFEWINKKKESDVKD